ncbi:MAG: hypothetical protein Q9O24_11560 [Gammaproteobacteria bacterium]|nr:hypothetical protein [Gammaproteobacteria bacterium]
MNAAYKEESDEVGVSITSLYNKLNGISTETSAALVRETAREKPRSLLLWTEQEQPC